MCNTFKMWLDIYNIVHLIHSHILFRVYGHIVDEFCRTRASDSLNSSSFMYEQWTSQRTSVYVADNKDQLLTSLRNEFAA